MKYFWLLLLRFLLQKHVCKYRRINFYIRTLKRKPYLECQMLNDVSLYKL